jgi:hypothetical protein
MRAQTTPAMLVLACALAQAAPAGAETLRMGVRDDARPFVYRDEDGRYRGFIYELCRAAAASAGHPEPEHVPVTASNRFEAMRDGDSGLDLLCDPTTITLGRAAEWDFSPIVFVANSTFLRRTGAEALTADEARRLGCDPGDAERAVVAGWVGGTTADTALDLAIEREQVRPGDGVAVCRASFDDHAAGFDALCGASGELGYYFGDADILAAHLAERQQRPEGCPAAFGGAFYLYEPYALVIGGRLPNFKRRFVHGIYAYFREGGGEAAFETYFEGRRMSPALETLFRLYRIPGDGPAPVQY